MQSVGRRARTLTSRAAATRNLPRALVAPGRGPVAVVLVPGSAGPGPRGPAVVPAVAPPAAVPGVPVVPLAVVPGPAPEVAIVPGAPGPVVLVPVRAPAPGPGPAVLARAGAVWPPGGLPPRRAPPGPAPRVLWVPPGRPLGLQLRQPVPYGLPAPVLAPLAQFFHPGLGIVGRVLEARDGADHLAPGEGRGAAGLHAGLQLRLAPAQGFRLLVESEALVNRSGVPGGLSAHLELLDLVFEALEGLGGLRRADLRLGHLRSRLHPRFKRGDAPIHLVDQ
mmetsp:Transcript_10264/g.34887  ORF Transcript_10264/g.34887 Transcript_10264/m.34887 type:complete len:279 (-) Transcript_10264:401-1237(-)